MSCKCKQYHTCKQVLLAVSSRPLNRCWSVLFSFHPMNINILQKRMRAQHQIGAVIFHREHLFSWFNIQLIFIMCDFCQLCAFFHQFLSHYVGRIHWPNHSTVYNLNNNLFTKQWDIFWVHWSNASSIIDVRMCNFAIKLVSLSISIIIFLALLIVSFDDLRYVRHACTCC